MRILCDQHVNHKYVHALQRADGITVTTVRHFIDADALDSEIASYAAENDWLVLTSDDDFFTERRTHGLLLYQQLAPVIFQAVNSSGSRSFQLSVVGSSRWGSAPRS